MIKLTEWNDVEKYIQGLVFADAYFLNILHTLDLEGDFLSKGQLASKIWLMNLLQNKKYLSATHNYNHYNICVAASWVGILPYMIHAKNKDCTITGIDIDKNCEKIATMFNKYNKYKHKVSDIFDENYSEYDLVINTSTEHFDLDNWLDVIPSGTNVLLQNTNLPDNTHVNNYYSLNSFVKSLEKKIYISEQDELQLPQYNRYMVYGCKK